ncbi:carbohydrate kinase family protein [Mycolicibacterium sp. CBM1]
MQGNHTLGREESRAVRLVDSRDRCKLHIILHYVARLSRPRPLIVPVGCVGEDAAGRTVLTEMASEGMDVSLVSMDRQKPTLNSICFTYPDGDGGNLTFVDTASADVGPADIGAAESLFVEHAGRGIALAAPEVGLAARMALLELATRYRFRRFASFLSAEMAEVHASGMLELVDVLSINSDEAAALVGHGGKQEPSDPVDIVGRAADLLVKTYPALQFCITAGRRGSWVWNGAELVHREPRAVQAVNTAGAGDAHLAGLIMGELRGLGLVAANAFASLLSALSVTSRDTINTDLEADEPALRALIDDMAVKQC